MSDNVEQNLWRKVNKVLPFLRGVPFLRMVAVCNNLAFGKVDSKSDIDLFIVAKTGRLFFVRTVVTLLLHIRGVRRHGNKVAGRFCLSFFVDDSFLDLSKIAIENDLYLAYWVKTMVPIINDGVFEKFVSKNGWVDDYFENTSGIERERSSELVVNELRSNNEFWTWMFDGVIGDLAESVLKKWQMRRASKKALRAGERASLLVEEHVLKFHNVDRRKFYRDKWLDKYGESAKLTSDRFLSL